MSSSVIGELPAGACSGSGALWSKLFPPADAETPRELPACSPPPSPREPSSTRSLATTSVMYFFWPDVLSSQERVCRRPSMYTLPPFFRYSPAISASRCQSTTLCHSVRSCHWPSLPLKRSFVANVIFATGVPCGVNFTSGSLPRFPIRMTLFTLFMVLAPSLTFETLTIAELGNPDAVSPVPKICDESEGRRGNGFRHPRRQRRIEFPVETRLAGSPTDRKFRIGLHCLFGQVGEGRGVGNGKRADRIETPCPTWRAPSH